MRRRIPGYNRRKITKNKSWRLTIISSGIGSQLVNDFKVVMKEKTRKLEASHSVERNSLHRDLVISLAIKRSP